MFFQMRPDFFLVVSTRTLYFQHLGIDQSAIPPALKEVPQKALLALHEAQLEEVAVAEISKRTPEQWLPCILVLAHTLGQRLLVELPVVVIFGRTCKLEFNVKQVDSLTHSIIDMFVQKTNLNH